jgi:ABC-2 type transport system permease protein
MTTSLHQIGVITRLTFREAQRRRLLWIGLGLGTVFVALFSLGFYFAYHDMTRSAINAPARGAVVSQFSSVMLSAGLYVVNFLIVMITVLISVGSISGEIASQTIHSLASKPIRRWEIVLGKWLGLAAMLTAYTILLAVSLVAAVSLISGYSPRDPLPALGILILEGLAVLSVTLLGSSLISTLANGVVIFMLYGVAFVGGWVEQIGTLAGSPTARDIGIASSLFMPSEALWRYAASLLQPPGLLGSLSPFSVTSQPTPAFVAYAALYTLAMLIAAMWAFSRRDF